MDLTRYNDLLRKLMAGDNSVMAELSELQPKVLAWKQAQRKKAPEPKAEVEAETRQVIDKYKKKNKKPKEEE